MDTGSSDKRPVLLLQRGLVALLTAVRRIVASVYQVAFRDRLGRIDRQTDRLGSASVEAVTHLGSEVRALDQRLAAIERELAALRELLEREERPTVEDGEQVPARPC